MRGSALAQPQPPKLPRELALAERWAKDAGKEVQRAVADTPQGKIPVVVVKHADRPVLVRLERKCIAVFAIAQVDQQMREKLASLETSVQQRVLIALTDELLSSPRTGYTLSPLGLKSITNLERVSVEEVIAISETDPSSRNRFLDAIQEVVTVMVRGMRILAITGDEPPPTASAAPPSPPPETMYR